MIIFVNLPWKPKLGPNLRREFRKFNIKTVFKLNKYLKTLLYQNKSNLLPNRYPDVYKLTCSCDAVC